MESGQAHQQGINNWKCHYSVESKVVIYSLSQIFKRNSDLQKHIKLTHSTEEESPESDCPQCGMVDTTQLETVDWI